MSEVSAYPACPAHPYAPHGHLGPDTPRARLAFTLSEAATVEAQRGEVALDAGV